MKCTEGCGGSIQPIICFHFYYDLMENMDFGRPFYLVEKKIKNFKTLKNNLIDGLEEI